MRNSGFKGACDAHGNVRLSDIGAIADWLCDKIKSRLGINRARGDTFSYLPLLHRLRV